MPALDLPEMPLVSLDARISAFVGPLAAAASTPLTKMLISLSIGKGNIWPSACFYS
jgi:hypothetical protein